MELLKFLTCGSVDDGKSTLIGHMLYAAKLIFADQRQALELESRLGSADGGIDYSYLLDGLEAEREQGITIDVAYRYFSTEKRRFIVADTPGHEEFTRNMAVGASFANLAVILLDATKGVLPQTRRHFRICALVGIRDFVFVVNKMDICHYDKCVFDDIENRILDLVEEVSKEMEIVFHSTYVIPVSALKGDNLTHRSPLMNWFDGEALLPYLETIEVGRPSADASFFMPVQRVCRPNASFRGYQGEVQGGRIARGDAIRISPSGETAKISSIFSAGCEVQDAGEGEAVTLCLDRDVDVSRGMVISATDKDLCQGDSFLAELLWMNDTDLCDQRRFKLQIGTNKVGCIIADIRFKINVDSWGHEKTDRLKKNELAACEIHTDMPVVFDRFSSTPGLGGFILIDRLTNATAGCGIIRQPIGLEGKLYFQTTSITRVLREQRNGYQAKTIWFTGLSGAGKSTIADCLEKKLFAQGINTMTLDGDNVRMGLCKGLNFSPDGRKENIRRVAEAAKLLNDAGVVVCCAFISPFRADRQMARDIIGSDSFVEVFVDASLDTCIRRDTKGLYRKAMQGEIREFTGIASPYEPPKNPDVTINTERMSEQECADRVIETIWAGGLH